MTETDLRPFRKARPAFLVRRLGNLVDHMEDHGHPVTGEQGYPGFDRFCTFDKAGRQPAVGRKKWVGGS
ncbi:hypothetical protein MOV08_32940 [Streptomyces yunnanensis]|uniref:Uncharacterized protein n=1 Tax=Streptomyces yunnanensis TaxID=156453 RepID=A0ABY8AF33_9ACTN|nr:hypothetical protein [Streptomyces yunnanensis]WEB43612.1 hypothetical protein MOV08_32940 [Streptomyces yunnanensis]